VEPAGVSHRFPPPAIGCMQWRTVRASPAGRRVQRSPPVHSRAPLHAPENVAGESAVSPTPSASVPRRFVLNAHRRSSSALNARIIRARLLVRFLHGFRVSRQRQGDKKRETERGQWWRARFRVRGSERRCCPRPEGGLQTRRRTGALLCPAPQLRTVAPSRAASCERS
jgi:hypothetical protein